MKSTILICMTAMMFLGAATFPTASGAEPAEQ